MLRKLSEVLTGLLRMEQGTPEEVVPSEGHKYLQEGCDTRGEFDDTRRRSERPEDWLNY